jgi:prepilin-type N-terminal cleavage/methylation domain-containing protein
MAAAKNSKTPLLRFLRVAPLSLGGQNKREQRAEIMSDGLRPGIGSGGFTLIEVVVSLAIVTVLFGGILTAYINATRQAEWAGYSLAAQTTGIQQIEQARSAVWDYSIGKNELTNLNLLARSYNAGTKVLTGYTTNVLDLPVSGGNAILVTNFVTVKMLSLTGVPNVQVQMVRVDTVWPFCSLRGQRLFTNSTASYFGPDNRDAGSL